MNHGTIARANLFLIDLGLLAERRFPLRGERGSRYGICDRHATNHNPGRVDRLDGLRPEAILVHRATLDDVWGWIEGNYPTYERARWEMTNRLRVELGLPTLEQHGSDFYSEFEPYEEDGKQGDHGSDGGSAERPRGDA